MIDDREILNTKKKQHNREEQSKQTKQRTTNKREIRRTMDDANMVCSDGLYNEGNNVMMPMRNGGLINPELAKSVAHAQFALPETSLEDDRTIIMDLMLASMQTIAPLIEREADNAYTVDDLKVRFR